MTAPRLDVRSDFPILARAVHGKPLVYLDNAASSQKPRAVIDAMSRYYLQSNANVHRGVHVLSQEATDAYEGVRPKVRAFIGARHDHEVIFTRGTTESINLVATAWARDNLKPGDAVVVTRMEHHSNFVPWQAVAKRTGAEFRIAELKSDLSVDLDHFSECLRGRPKIVAISMMSNVLGVLNPVAEMARMAKDAGALVLVDAAQAVAHLPVRIAELGPIDFLAFSSHKMCGPTGIGVLWGREEVLNAMSPYQYGGDMIRRVGDRDTDWNELPYKFEAGTPAIAEVIGLGAAIDYLSGIGMEKIKAYEQWLASEVYGRMERLEGVKLVKAAGAVRAPILNFVVDGVHPHDLAQLLDSEGVAVRAGHHCVQPLLTKLGHPATTRASFAFYNTVDEADALVEAVRKAQAYFARPASRAQGGRK